MHNVGEFQSGHHIVVEIMDINLERLLPEVVLPGENILSTHADLESVQINYESHSVSKIYIFLYVAEENN